MDRGESIKILNYAHIFLICIVNMKNNSEQNTWKHKLPSLNDPILFIDSLAGTRNTVRW
jgi:hypothetical protein